MILALNYGGVVISWSPRISVLAASWHEEEQLKCLDLNLSSNETQNVCDLEYGIFESEVPSSLGPNKEAGGFVPSLSP